jgi:hypothetical protein
LKPSAPVCLHGIENVSQFIIIGSIMSFLSGMALILALLLWNPTFPWITFVILVGFFFLPFRKIIRLFPGTQPDGRINPPLHKSKTSAEE